MADSILRTSNMSNYNLPFVYNERLNFSNDGHKLGPIARSILDHIGCFYTVQLDDDGLQRPMERKGDPF